MSNIANPAQMSQKMGDCPSGRSRALLRRMETPATRTMKYRNWLALTSPMLNVSRTRHYMRLQAMRLGELLRRMSDSKMGLPAGLD